MVVTQRSKLAYAIVDAERCKGCGYCIAFCPKKTIGLADRANQGGYTPALFLDDKNGCTGCANCAVVCPEAAISVYRCASEDQS